MNLLEVSDLRVALEGKEILKGLNLNIASGEVHAIMGPNGSGKSTLSKVLAGHPDYTITGGAVRYEINFKHQDLLALEAHERAQEGVFLAFQYPIEVAGVSNTEFLRAAFNEVVSHQGGQTLDAMDFDTYLREKMRFLEVPENFAERQVNVDFSGGEKKRNEILQMAVLAPRLALLDETDSGLDVDSLRAVASGVNKLRSPERSIVLITHYQRLLEYIVPDFVHILYDGRIIKSGDRSLALEIESRGYEHIIAEVNA